jgi:hypothetical protein
MGLEARLIGLVSGGSVFRNGSLWERVCEELKGREPRVGESEGREDFGEGRRTVGGRRMETCTSDDLRLPGELYSVR